MRQRTARWNPQILAALSICVVLFVVGCKSKSGKFASAKTGSENIAEDPFYDEDGNLLDPSVNVEEASIRTGEFTDIPDLQPITFKYDRYALSSASRVHLKNNAQYLKSHPDLKFLVEGHSDERGTMGYNLALSQRRAKAVREYYIRLGVAGQTIGTISYGEEKPTCTESHDECWTRNRRAETLVSKQGDGGDQAILPENAASESRETR